MHFTGTLAELGLAADQQVADHRFGFKLFSQPAFSGLLPGVFALRECGPSRLRLNLA